MGNEWKKPKAPPPPLFLGKKERDLVKQVNDELVEKIIGQQILYYAIDMDTTNFHDMYGEAIEKNFLPPIRVYVLVDWNGNETTTTGYGLDRIYELTCHFHKRRLTEDQDVFVREGDFILYNGQYYEIITLNEPKQLFGQNENQLEISARCAKAREGLFDGK